MEGDLLFSRCLQRQKVYTNMDGFSLAILQRAAELVIEDMQPDRNPPVAHCLKVIQQYLQDPTCVHENELHDAVIRLLDIAREDHQVIVAARLAYMVERFEKTLRQSGAA